MVHGPGPWTGPMGWSMDQVHGVVHGPRSMLCVRPCLHGVMQNLDAIIRVRMLLCVGSAGLCSKNRVLCFWASSMKPGYYAQNYAQLEVLCSNYAGLK